MNLISKALILNTNGSPRMRLLNTIKLDNPLKTKSPVSGY